VSNPKWYETFFEGPAVDLWEMAMPEEWTNREAAFLEKNLNLKPGSRVLDVPCGNGRHAIALAKRGCIVTGLDISEEFLARARVHAASASVTVAFQHADMNRLPDMGSFDGAYCFGNSFGYLSPEEALVLLRGIAARLNPGGRFAIETGMMAESVLNNMPTSRWHEIGDMYMLSRNRYFPMEGRLDIDYTFIRNGKADTRPTSSYTMTCRELCRLFAEAGLSAVSLSKSVEGEPFELGSQCLVAVAQLSG
jgi:SAM-dependent methyltransferase